MGDYSGIAPGSIESYYNRFDPNARQRAELEADRFRGYAWAHWQLFPCGPVQEKQGLMMLSAFSQWVIITGLSLFLYFRYGMDIPAIGKGTNAGTLVVLTAIFLPGAWCGYLLSRLLRLLRRERRHDFLRFKRKYPHLAAAL